MFPTPPPIPACQSSNRWYLPHPSCSSSCFPTPGWRAPSTTRASAPSHNTTTYHRCSYASGGPAIKYSSLGLRPAWANPESHQRAAACGVSSAASMHCSLRPQMQNVIYICINRTLFLIPAVSHHTSA